MRNDLKTLVKTLLTEGKVIEKELINEDTIILTVEAFGHRYRIEAPYTMRCRIIQER